MLDENYNIKFMDFGFAAPIEGRDGSGYLTTPLGTKAYMSPELLSGQPYSGVQADLFASAVILFIFVTGVPPVPYVHHPIQDKIYNLLAIGNIN